MRNLVVVFASLTLSLAAEPVVVAPSVTVDDAVRQSLAFSGTLQIKALDVARAEAAVGDERHRGPHAVGVGGGQVAEDRLPDVADEGIEEFAGQHRDRPAIAAGCMPLGDPAAGIHGRGRSAGHRGSGRQWAGRSPVAHG